MVTTGKGNYAGVTHATGAPKERLACIIPIV